MPENIILTAGGTSEPIDRIRSITNTSTGMLGRLIARELSKSDKVGRIFYIHGKKAVMPDCEKVTPVPVESVENLLDAVNKLCSSYKIDAVIHCMAVSDFRVRSVVSAEMLDKKAAGGAFNPKEFFDSENLLSKYNKLPSSSGEPVILLEKTPKVLPIFRQLLPDAVIVGFKLLDGVSHEELIDTAYRLLEKNGCDYVLANDYRTVEAGKHEGFLIDGDKKELHFCGKQEIARGIAAAVAGGKANE